MVEWGRTDYLTSEFLPSYLLPSRKMQIDRSTLPRYSVRYQSLRVKSALNQINPPRLPFPKDRDSNATLRRYLRPSKLCHTPISTVARIKGPRPFFFFPSSHTTRSSFAALCYSKSHSYLLSFTRCSCASARRLYLPYPETRHGF